MSEEPITIENKPLPKFRDHKDTTEIDLKSGFPAFDRTPDSDLPPRIRRRLQEREDWKAYWDLRAYEVRFWNYPAYFMSRYLVDVPVTWFREKIVEPMHDRYKRPYYHRKFNRAFEIDQCGVNDKACYNEAAEQFRLDKLVDRYILHTLQNRINDCLIEHEQNRNFCVKMIDGWQEAELNWFIKYGELGSAANVEDCYMKQKHRMIWERRHPEIMKLRQQRFELHKKRVENGDLDLHFYKKGKFWQEKSTYGGVYEPNYDRPTMEGDQPVSKDWEYYKKASQDPKFDPKGGDTAIYEMNPFKGKV